MNGKFELLFNDDKTECWIKFYTNIDDITIEEINTSLTDVGVTFGVKHTIIRSFFDSDAKLNLNRKYLIAEGSKPKHGVDGSIKYLIKDGPTLKEDKDGVINYYDIGIIKKINEGDKLVEIVEPLLGEFGISVTNDRVEGLKGSKYPIYNVIGTGVSIDGNFIVAKNDGCYKKSYRGKIDIVKVLEIFEDLNFTIGSIDIPATVIIHGDILPNFNCRSTNDIEVYGVIEDSQIDCGENLICRSGFVQGINPITAGKNIRVKYISSREHVTCKNLYVKENVYSSNIKVSSYMEARKISGGEVWVKNELIVKDLGNEQFQETIIRIGLGEEDARQIKILEDDLDLISSDIELIKRDKIEKENEITRLKKEKDNPWKKDDKLHKTKIYNQIKEVTKLIERCNEEIKDLEGKYEISEKMLIPYKQFLKLNRSKVIVGGTVFPNVKIIFNGEQIYEVRNQLSNVMFMIDKLGELKPFNNKDKVVLKSFRF